MRDSICVSHSFYSCSLWRNHKLAFFHEEVIKWKSIYYTSLSSSDRAHTRTCTRIAHATRKAQKCAYNHFMQFYNKIMVSMKMAEKCVRLHRLRARARHSKSSPTSALNTFEMLFFPVLHTFATNHSWCVSHVFFLHLQLVLLDFSFFHFNL